MVAHKATKQEALLKVQEIYGRRCNGQSRNRILQECSEQWGCSTRQVETYYARAGELIENDCEMARPAFLAELLAGIREVREQAARRGQHQVALNAIRLQAELVGLTK